MINENNLYKYFGNKLLFNETSVSKFNKEKELFISIIEKIQQAIDKESMLLESYNIDLYEYSNIYYEIIGDLMLLKYGPSLDEIIQWFLYERININESGDQEIIPLIFLDEEKNIKEDVYLETPEDLWNFINKIINRISKNE